MFQVAESQVRWIPAANVTLAASSLLLMWVAEVRRRQVPGVQLLLAFLLGLAAMRAGARAAAGIPPLPCASSQTAAGGGRGGCDSRERQSDGGGAPLGGTWTCDETGRLTLRWGLIDPPRNNTAERGGVRLAA
jgi:hypothetical protein